MGGVLPGLSLLDSNRILWRDASMKNIIRFLFGLVVIWGCSVLVVSAGPVQARSAGIAIVVNEGAVSFSELNERIHLTMVSSGLPNTGDIREKLLPQVVDSLIEEQIKMQEAERLGITVGQEDIDRGFSMIAQQNNFTPDQFMAALRQSGIKMGTMYDQIRSEIAWSKVVQAELRPKVSVTDTDVENVLKRLKSSVGETEYLLAEIFLPVEDPQKEQSVRQLAARLSQQLRSGKAPFFKVAQQFSKAAGAANGGDMGWVQAAYLPERIVQALSKLPKNSLSEPVRSLNGYHILFLRDVRTLSEDTIPSRDQIRGNLGTERLDRLQRRYFLDLKAAAFIESRVDS